MDVHTAIRTRYSARSYQDRPVEAEKLERVLEAARLAPSARNDQEWRFIVVQDPEIRRRLMSAAFDQPFVGQAPVVIAACAETDGRIMTCGQPGYTVNVAIAVDHLTLAATAEGLGTCWVCRFDEGAAKQALGIPEDPSVRIVTLLPLGYPVDQPPAMKPRRKLEEIVRREHW
ncbi:MAG: nitroreductase [Candidatus Eisenbacteria bacterium]|nr:nitroreductase [Candidatus Eisenbacteria bacterium]